MLIRVSPPKPPSGVAKGCVLATMDGVWRRRSEPQTDEMAGLVTIACWRRRSGHLWRVQQCVLCFRLCTAHIIARGGRCCLRSFSRERRQRSEEGKCAGFFVNKGSPHRSVFLPLLTEFAKPQEIHISHTVPLFFVLPWAFFKSSRRSALSGLRGQNIDQAFGACGGRALKRCLLLLLSTERACKSENWPNLRRRRRSGIEYGTS